MLIFNRVLLPDFRIIQENPKIVVNKITSPVLGAEVRKVEDRRRLSEQDRTKIKFLKAAINFLPRWSRPEKCSVHLRTIRDGIYRQGWKRRLGILFLRRQY